jgi:hypothetical protein
MALLGTRHHGGRVEPVLGQAERRALDGEDRGRGRHRRSVLHHEQGGGGRRSRADAADRLRDQGAGGLFGSDRFRLAVSADGSTFFDGLSVDNATGIVDQPRLPRFKAYTNYDNYVGVGTWTKIGLNNTDYNDQGGFDAANNLFVAPVDGTYLFGATLLYKINSSTSARMRGRLVLNGATEIRGSYGEISGAHVSEATALWLQTMVPLTAGDTLSCRGISGRRMGTSRPITRPFGAARSAERRKEDPMTPPRSDQGFVRMPDAEFEAILTRAAEEGAKRALADVGPRRRRGRARHPRPALLARLHPAGASHRHADRRLHDHHRRHAGAPRRHRDQAEDLRRRSIAEPHPHIRPQ